MDTHQGARTKDEAIRDLDYVIRLSQRHERLFTRMHNLLRFAELLGGSAAVATAISGVPWALHVAGVLLALVACANFAFDPGATAREHRRCGAEYTGIRADVDQLSLEEIDRRRRQVLDPTYWESLRLPSWNDMMRRHGYASSVQPLTRWQRLAAAVA